LGDLRIIQLWNLRGCRVGQSMVLDVINQLIEQIPSQIAPNAQSVSRQPAGV